MKICLPTENDAGLLAELSPNLGRAPFLTLIDTDSGAIDVVGNAPHGEHGCAPAEPLAGRDVSAVICLGAGVGAVSQLEALGIQVLMTRATSVREALIAARDGELWRLRASHGACGSHGAADSGCGGCHHDEPEAESAS
jgi:predicted Fe-Mo cluster-binding NifX family protein